MSTTKLASVHAAHATSRWRKFLIETGANRILEPLEPVPSVIALRFRRIETLRIGFADYLEPGDQAHWGNLSDGRRVVVIRRQASLDHGELVHLELIQGRPFSESLPEGDATGFDHLGLRIHPHSDLDELAVRLGQLDGISTIVSGDEPFQRLKIVYRDATDIRHEFKLVHHRLWDVCLAEMLTFL